MQLNTHEALIPLRNLLQTEKNIDVKKMIQPKGLYFTRPVMGQYLSTKDEIREGSEKLFEKVKLGKIKIEIFKKYKLEDVVQAHKDLEARKIIGPAIINP